MKKAPERELFFVNCGQNCGQRVFLSKEKKPENAVFSRLFDWCGKQDLNLFPWKTNQK